MACHGGGVNFHSSNDSMMFASRSFDDSLLTDTFTTKLHVASSLTDDFAWKFDDLFSRIETQSTRRTDEESLDEGTITILHDVSSTDKTDRTEDVNRMEEVEMFYVPVPSEDYQSAMKVKDYQSAMKVKEATKVEEVPQVQEATKMNDTTNILEARDCQDLDERSMSISRRDTLNREVEGRTISIPGRTVEDIFHDDRRMDDIFRDDRRLDDIFHDDRRIDELFHDDRGEDDLFRDGRRVNKPFLDDRREGDLFRDDRRLEDLLRNRVDDLLHNDRRVDDLFNEDRRGGDMCHDGIENDIDYTGNYRKQNKTHQVINSKQTQAMNGRKAQNSVRRQQSNPSQQKRFIQKQYEDRLRSSSRPGAPGQRPSLRPKTPVMNHGHGKNQVIGRRVKETRKREVPNISKRNSLNHTKRSAPVSARVTQAMKQEREKKKPLPGRRRGLGMRGTPTRQRSQSLDPNHKRINRPAYHRLYATSSVKQMEGKKRREMLEKSYKQKAARRNGELVKKTGKISIEKAAKLYDRCMYSKIKHEAKVAKLIEEKIVEEENRSSISNTKERKSTAKFKKPLNGRSRPNWSSQMYWNQGEDRCPRMQYTYALENQLFPITEESSILAE